MLGIIAAATSVARAYVRRVTGPEFQAAVVEALTEQNRTIGRLAEQIGAAIEGVNQLRVDVVRHTLDCPAARSGRSSQGAIS